jgi:hypothetical protein
MTWEKGDVAVVSADVVTPVGCRDIMCTVPVGEVDVAETGLTIAVEVEATSSHPHHQAQALGR